MRQRYGFSEYALHEYAKTARVGWIADHLDAVLAQTLASRAYRALNRVCVGEARRVRFKSRGRGLGSIENKRNETGLRFMLQKPEQAMRRLQRQMDRQRRAANPEHYDERGCIKKQGKKQRHWKTSKSYERRRRRKATRERKSVMAAAVS